MTCSYFCTSDELLQGHDFHIVILKQPKTEKAVQFAFAQDYSTLYEVKYSQGDLLSYIYVKCRGRFLVLV